MEHHAITSAGTRAPFMEHRWGQRMTCRARVTFRGRHALEGAGRLRDISSSGAFIETPAAIPVHARLTLTVTGNESATRSVDVAAIVVRADADGIGVEWCETPEGNVCTTVGCVHTCAARD